MNEGVLREDARDAAPLRARADRPRREIYLITARRSGSFDALDALRPRHLDYLHALTCTGTLLLAGPTLVDAGACYTGDGCMLLAAADFDSAHALAERDPYHIEGVRANVVTPWLASEGALFAPLLALGG